MPITLDDLELEKKKKMLTLDDLEPQIISNNAILDNLQPQQKSRPLTLDDLELKKTAKPIILEDLEPKKGIIQKGVETVLGKGFTTGKFNEMTTLGQVLDISARPTYATQSVIREIQRQTPKQRTAQEMQEQFPEYINRDLTPPEEVMYKPAEKPFSIPEIAKAAWQGLQGKSRPNPEDILEAEGIKARFPGLGLAMNIATDPLMYGGYSAIFKGAGKISEITSKGLQKIPLVAKATAVTSAKLAPVTKGFKNLFITKSGIGALSDLIENQLAKRGYQTFKELRFARKTRNVIQNISKNTGHSIDDVERQIVNLIESPEVIPRGATKEAQLLAKTLKNHYDNFLINEINAGVPIAGLGTGQTARVSYLRDKLNIIRDTKRQELTSAKQVLQSQLDDLAKVKTTKIEKGLTQEANQIRIKAFKDNQSRINSLIEKTKNIDDQIRIYERQLEQATLKDLPTSRIENYIKRLENEYWYHTGEIADRIQDIPELATNSPYLNRIKEIEDILYKTGIDTDLGRTGVSLGKKIYKIEEKLATGLPPEGKRAGKLLKDIADIRAQKQLGYFPRITTKEAGEYLKNASRGGYGYKAWNPKIQNALKRKTGDFTLEEFNDFVAQNGLKSLGGNSVEQFFLQEPAVATYLRGVRSARAITSAEFLDQAGKTFGVRTKVVGWEQLPDSIIRLNPELKGLYYAPEVLDEITRVVPRYMNPGELRFVGKVFNDIQNTWKRWTLAPFPKYHLRNMVGNLWNIYLEGSTRPEHFNQMQAIQFYRKYKGNEGVLGNIAKKNLTNTGLTVQRADELINAMEQLNVVSTGWFATDIEENLKHNLQQGFLQQPIRTKVNRILNPFSESNIVTERGMALGTTIENNSRGALFLARLEKGDDLLSAARIVKKHLFDYGDLTAFEKQTMKRIFPFYTWTRKNIPLQLEYLWKQPEKFAPIRSLLIGRNPQDLLRLKYARPDLYERLPVEIRRDADTVTYVPLEGLIPAADLVKIGSPQQTYELFMEMLTPMIRTPLELAFNKSLYFESEIQRYPKETQELLRMDIPVRFKYALTTLYPQARLLNELNKFTKKTIKGEKLTIGEQAFSQSLSSIYKVSIRDLRDRAIKSIERKQEDLEVAKYWARKNRRIKEYQNIQRTIREVKQELREVK